MEDYGKLTDAMWTKCLNMLRGNRLIEAIEIFLVDLEELIFLSDVTLIGVPIGYCCVADRHKRTMKFERLEFVK